MPTHSDKLISEIHDADELARNRLQAWKDDYEWRRRYVDMEGYLNYYEGDPDPERNDNRELVETDDEGFPRINLTQRSVDDSVYFVLRNLPDARLRASKSHLDSNLDPLERDLRLTNIQMTEDTMNSLMDTILEDNLYRDKVERAILDAGIYGVGYLFTSVDRSTSVLRSEEVRGLLEKAKKGEKWTKKDAQRYKQATMRPDINYYDARRVTMMAGVRRFDSPRMLRCSVLEHFRTESLKRRYSDVEGIEGLSSGGVDQYLDQEEEAALRSTDIETTSLLTTWEIEPFEDTVTIPGTNRTAQFTNARMVKTVVAGDILVDKKQWEASDGFVSLPIVPFQFRQSRRHPYGRSEAKSLAQSEKLVNKVRSMMYKSGLNSVRPDGVSIFVQNLGPNDRQELEDSFEEGGPAFITGNMVGQEVSDIREIVMPHTFASSPLDPALRQMMNMEMEAFRFNSSKGNSQAVDKARTGRSKRAQIAFNDRPKNFSVLQITGSIKRLYENLYEIIQTVYRDTSVPAEVKGEAGRREVRVNEEVTLRDMPVLDEQGNKRTEESLETPENPDGMVTRDIEFVLNSTNFDMDARVENRAELPFDIPSRHQIVRQLEADRYISHDYARRLILSDEMRLRDDMQRRSKQRQQRRQAAQALRQRAGVNPQGPTPQQGRPPEQESPEGGEQQGGEQQRQQEGVAQDVADNLRQRINQQTEQ